MTMGKTPFVMELKIGRRENLLHIRWDGSDDVNKLIRHRVREVKAVGVERLPLDFIHCAAVEAVA